MASLLAEIKDQILPNSTKRKKYRALLDVFDANPNRSGEATPEVVFLTPHTPASEVRGELERRGFRWFDLVEMLETFQPRHHQELWLHVRRLRQAL